MLAVLDAVDAELLVGHSYGALCSILAAERTDCLDRLVLYEPPIAVREPGLDELERLVAEGEHDVALEAFLRSAGIRDEQFETVRSSPAWPRLAETMPVLPRELRSCAAWQHPQGPITVPTLFLLGARTDAPAYLDGLDDLRGAFPDLRRELIPGQRHAAHVFAADRFAELIAGFCFGASS